MRSGLETGDNFTFPGELYDGSLILRLVPQAMPFAARATEALLPLLDSQPVTIQEIPGEGKILQYTSDLEQTPA